MKKKIKVSFIGAGNMSNEHLKVLNRNKFFVLGGIYSRSQKKIHSLKKKYRKLKIYSSIEDLYHKTKSDLVIISISEEQYKKIMKKIIKFPWVCLAEKPLGLNSREIKQIYKLSRIKKRKIFISLNRRFYISTIRLKKIVDNFSSKRKLKIIDCQNRQRFEEGAKKIGIVKSAKSIKYLMYSNSVHLIDFINLFCRGNLLKTSSNNWTIEKPKNFTIKMKFSSGDEVVYEAYWKKFRKWEVQIKFDKYNLKLKPLEKLNTSNNFPEIKKINYTKDENFKPGLVNQSIEIKNFFQKKEHKLVSIENYMRTVTLIKKIYNV